MPPISAKTTTNGANTAHQHENASTQTHWAHAANRTLASLIRVTLDTGDSDYDTFTFIRPNTWKAKTIQLFPQLRLIQSSTTTQLEYTHTTIPAGLGIVPVCILRNKLLSLCHVRVDSEDITAIGRAILAGNSGPDPEIEWFDIQTLECHNNVYLIPLLNESLNCSREQPITLRFYTRKGSDVGGSGSPDQIGLFSFFILPLPLKQYNGRARGASQSSEQQLDAAAEAAAPQSSSDTFYSMVKYNEQRTNTDNDQTHLANTNSHSKRESNTQNNLPHPLFSQWVSEDGPAFRALIHKMEGQAAANKLSYKNLIRSASGLKEASQAFTKTLNEAMAPLEMLPVFNPLYTSFAQPLVRSVDTLLTAICTNWNNVVIEKVRSVYESSYKTLDNKKSDFTFASDQYYGEMTKYLKSKSSSRDRSRDTEFSRQRIGFDSVRWSYFVSLWTISGGWREMELLISYLKWVKLVVGLQEQKNATPKFDNTVNWYLSQIPTLSNEIQHQRSEADAFDQNIKSMDLSPVNETPNDALFFDSHHNLPGIQTSTTIIPASEISMNRLRLSAIQSPDDSNILIVPRTQPPNTNTSAQSNEVYMRDTGTQRCSFEEVRDGTPVTRRPLQSVVNDGTREGFLFARVSSKNITTTKGMIATGSNIWRRYWCVVSDGGFQKYAHWKSQSMPEPRGSPIELNTATVRELSSSAKQSSRRRFCFEVITPNYYGVFQATGEQDMQMWVNAIRRAIELSLLSSSKKIQDVSENTTAKSIYIGRKSTDEAKRVSAYSQHSQTLLSYKIHSPCTQLSDKNHISSLAVNDSHNLLVPEHLHTNTEGSKMDNCSSNAVSMGAALNTILHIQPIHADDSFANLAPIDLGRRFSTTSLLPTLQLDSANQKCADCNAPMPEWCSLNLCCLLCIECSGIHRSLGTHISKVRSLTLDVVSFTPTTISMLLLTGNTLNTLVFESGLQTKMNSGAQKPHPDSIRQDKQRYIYDKYVSRLFLDRTWYPEGESREMFERILKDEDDKSTRMRKVKLGVFWDESTASELLFAASILNDLPIAMYALAFGANLNSSNSVISHINGEMLDATPLLITLFGIQGLQDVYSMLNNDNGMIAGRKDVIVNEFNPDFELADFLILNAAGVNLCDTFGRTPLHLACATGASTLIQYLIDKGANPLVQTKTGKYPSDLVSSKNQSVREILQTATDKEKRMLALSQPDLDSESNIGVHRNLSLWRGNGLDYKGHGAGIGVNYKICSSSNDLSNQESSALAAAFKLANRFSTSTAMGRISVSTERPTMHEIRDISRDSDSHTPHSSGPNRPGTSGNNSKQRRGRRLTSGIREFGNKLTSMPLLSKTGTSHITNDTNHKPNPEIPNTKGSINHTDQSTILFESKQHEDSSIKNINSKPASHNSNSLDPVYNKALPRLPEESTTISTNITFTNKVLTDKALSSTGNSDSSHLILPPITNSSLTFALDIPDARNNDRSGTLEKTNVIGKQNSVPKEPLSISTSSSKSPLHSQHTSDDPDASIERAPVIRSHSMRPGKHWQLLGKRPHKEQRYDSSRIGASSGDLGSYIKVDLYKQKKPNALRRYRDHVAEQSMGDVTSSNDDISTISTHIQPHSAVSPSPTSPSINIQHNNNVIPNAKNGKRLFRLLSKSSRVTFSDVFGRHDRRGSEN